MSKKVCFPFLEKDESLPFAGKDEAITSFPPSDLEGSLVEKSLRPILQKCTYTKKESFQKLVEIQELALSMEPKPDFTAALRSEELKGKLFGLYQDKSKEEGVSETVKLSPTALVCFK